APAAGGGLSIDGTYFNVGTVTLTNCTISGNSAFVDGGGLLIGRYGRATLTNCIVSGNSSSSGGGLSIYSAATLVNRIVGGNDGGDIAGSYLGSNNLSGVDPLLAPLGDYGGPTLTMALLPGSPAIGAGTDDGGPTNDQRNEPRTGHVDIGAFQSQGFTLAPVAGSTPQAALARMAFASPPAVT